MNDLRLHERWVDVNGSENCYKISNQGRVFSIKRVIKTTQGTRTVGGKLLNCTIGNNGYRIAKLCDDIAAEKGYATSKTVHKLVAEAFLGPRPKGHVVNHKNCDKTDNRAINLEYVTPSRNRLHAQENGRVPGWGEKQWQARLNEYQVRIIRNCKGDVTLEELAEIFGVTFQAISKIWLRKTWAHVEHPDYQAMLQSGESLTFGTRTLTKSVGTPEEDAASVRSVVSQLAQKHSMTFEQFMRCVDKP